MGLFDAFKKKECCICGNEVGIIGNRKLADGNMCSKCAKKLSPWFEDRRESTVAQIQEQLAYREQNEKDLELFTVTRIIGEADKMYIEEINGVPVRFFVTDAADYMTANPDIISFKDVVSCVTDIEVRDEEIRQKNSEGKMVSYNPPRYKHHHNFYIKMEIRNNPYFDDIKFSVNRGVVTLESVGGIGVGGLFGSAQRAVFGRSMGSTTVGNTFDNTREQRRYNEYRQMCEKIEQAVEDGKRSGGQTSNAAEPVQMLLEQMRNAPDMETVMQLSTAVAMLAVHASNKDEINRQMAQAMTEAQLRIAGAAVGAVSQAAETAPAQHAQSPKFCTNCGAPADGGKFCQHCGSKLE